MTKKKNLTCLREDCCFTSNWFSLSRFGLNFINVICTSYTQGAQKRKKDSQVVSLFTLSRSTSVKADRKIVGEIEPCRSVFFSLRFHSSCRYFLCFSLSLPPFSLFLSNSLYIYSWTSLYSRDWDSKNLLAYNEFAYKKIYNHCKLEDRFQKKGHF